MKKLVIVILFIASVIYLGSLVYGPAEAASRFCTPVAQAHMETMKRAPVGTLWLDFNKMDTKSILIWARENGLISKNLIAGSVRLYSSPYYHKVALGFSNRDCAVWMAVFDKELWETFKLGGREA